MVGWRLSLVTTVLGGDVEGAALVDGAFVVGGGVELGATVEDGGELDVAVVFGDDDGLVIAAPEQINAALELGEAIGRAEAAILQVLQRGQHGRILQWRQRRDPRVRVLGGADRDVGLEATFVDRDAGRGVVARGGQLQGLAGHAGVGAGEALSGDHLDAGYELHGSPTMTTKGSQVFVGQAVVLSAKATKKKKSKKK